MLTPRTTFPIAEGIGIFIGVIAWDLLTDGHIGLIKAVLIAIPCSLIWFIVRRWKEESNNKRH